VAELFSEKLHHMLLQVRDERLSDLLNISTFTVQDNVTPLFFSSFSLDPSTLPSKNKAFLNSLTFAHVKLQFKMHIQGLSRLSEWL